MRKKHYSLVKKEEIIYELLYDPTQNKTHFVALIDDKLEYTDTVTVFDEVYEPFPANYEFLRNGVVMFPSAAAEYENETTLVNEIRSFIHKHLELSEFFELITPYYILLTWIYENFEELAYLRVLGDYGTGKSRFLKTIGALCYKPMFTFAASSISSVFRMIDEFRGTFVFDEADLRYSDTNADMIKLLNSGYQAGLPVMRSGDNTVDFNPRSFQVYGPKLIASRFRYKDFALESRCLIEKMRPLKRKDITPNLGKEFHNEALQIRNKLLLWRLRNYGKRSTNDKIYDPTLEPRLNQIIFALSSVIPDETTFVILQAKIKEYQQELMDERSQSSEAVMLKIIISQLALNSQKELSVKQITDVYNTEREFGESALTYRKAGSILREKLGLKLYRKNVGFFLDSNYAFEELPELAKRYDLESEHVNMVNIVSARKDKPLSIQEELDLMGIEVEGPK